MRGRKDLVTETCRSSLPFELERTDLFLRAWTVYHAQHLPTQNISSGDQHVIEKNRGQP